MNIWLLTPEESANLAALNSRGCESVLMFVTGTGLKKHILDATEPLRNLLKNSGIHDYEKQGQGPENKVRKMSRFITETGLRQVPTSFYRPKTKQGDPRLWFSDFKQFTNADNVCAVFVHGGELCVLNLSQCRLAMDLERSVDNAITRFVRHVEFGALSASMELLDRLQRLARAGPLQAVCNGDTAIGRTIESALEIPINSSRSPDFRGIEIKAGRIPKTLGRKTRSQLFALVPDWDLSALKSSRAILDRFGYERGGDFKLYCTVSIRRANSQGLKLDVNEARQWLREYCVNEPVEDVCIWRLDSLHKRLIEKHRETFWISAKSSVLNGKEWFLLDSVVHTARPSIVHFDRLLLDGTITVDHMIKRRSNGRLAEKGPSFKVDPARVGELFMGTTRTYTLTERRTNE